MKTSGSYGNLQFERLKRKCWSLETNWSTCSQAELSLEASWERQDRAACLFFICSKNTTAVIWKEQVSHLCKVFCLFFSSLLAIQLSVLQINCLISAPHCQDCRGHGKPGSCIPVLLGGKCDILLLGMPYYHMVSSVNKPHRERCMSFGSPRRMPCYKWVCL